jgi:hypothetical protein
MKEVTLEPNRTLASSSFVVSAETTKKNAEITKQQIAGREVCIKLVIPLAQPASNTVDELAHASYNLDSYKDMVMGGFAPEEDSAFENLSD